MAAPHQQVIQSIQGTQSYSGVGRHHEPSASLLTSAGKRSHIAPLRDPRDASKRKKTTNDDVALLAEQGLYVAAAETIKTDAAAFKASIGGPAGAHAAKESKEQKQQGAHASAVSDKLNSVARRVGSAPGDRPSSSAVYASSVPRLEHHQQQQPIHHHHDDDDRNDTLVSSARQAIMKNKKRGGSAAVPSMPPSYAQQALGGAKSKKHGGPIVESLYTPGVAVDKRFLVKERLKLKERKFGCHVAENAAFKAVPRPSPGGDAAGTHKAPPPVGAYHPQYQAIESKRIVFSFESPSRSRSRHQKRRSSLDGRMTPGGDGAGGGGEHNRSLDETGDFGFQGFAGPGGGGGGGQFASATTRFSHAHGAMSPISGGTMSGFNLTSTFKSTQAQDASLRALRGNVDTNLHNKMQDGQNPNRDMGEFDQQQRDHQQNMQRGHATDVVPDHQTFSAAGTSAFASKAPRFHELDTRDKLEYPDTPWPLLSPGMAAVRPTGGGAVGAPLGKHVIPPDVPQPHNAATAKLNSSNPSSVARGAVAVAASPSMEANRRAMTPQPSPSPAAAVVATPSVVINNNEDDPYGIPPPARGGYSMPRWHPSDAALVSKSRSRRSDAGDASAAPGSSLLRAGRGTPPVVARTRRTFLDGLVSPAYNERPAGNDAATLARHTLGVSFDKAPGRYGHTTNTGASLRFQPIRSIGRTVDPDVTSSAPVLVAAEKFVEAGSINKLGHKEEDDVLSTKHRRVTPVSFDKQRNHRNNSAEAKFHREVVNPSTILTSPVPLEHPTMSMVHSRVPGLVALQPPKRSSQYQSATGKKGLLDVWNTSPEDILNSSSGGGGGGGDTSNASRGSEGGGRGPVDKVHDELSYSRTRSALILPQQHFHSQLGNKQQQQPPSSSSPSRFNFTSPARDGGGGGSRHVSPQAAGSVVQHSLLHNSTAHNQSTASGGGAAANPYRSIDEVRHARSPTAFFPSTGHNSHVVHRSDTSRAENLAKKGAQDEPTAIPLEKLLHAEGALRPRQQVGVDISKTMSRDERERRFVGGSTSASSMGNKRRK